MHRPRLAIGFLLAPIVVALLFSTLACGAGGTEKITIDKFFRASSLRDNATLANIATVSFDKNEQGVVENSSVVSTGEEKIQPLHIKEYAQANTDAVKARDEFTKKQLAFQDEHGTEIKNLLDQERKGAKLKGKDAEFQVTWNKWREDSKEIEKKVTETRTKLNNERQIAEISVFNPQNPVDVTQYDGEMASKDVTVKANIITPANQHVTKTLVLTLQQARLKGDKPIEGKWVITSVKDVTGGATS